MTASKRWVYDFSEGSREMRDLLGGKGANVAEMTKVLGPERVPSGFTITTEACVEYMRLGSAEPDGLQAQVRDALSRLEAQADKRLGDPDNPLLVSVRSGARESMPGMLDTVLNLGLSDASVIGLARVTNNERFALDSQRRLVQMLGNVARGIPGELFEDAISAAKQARGVRDDTDLDANALRELTVTFNGIYQDHVGQPFPEDPLEQLHMAIRAVFDSWLGDRAVAYRRLNGIPDNWGTAVNIQQMVFGNKGERSGSGVAFSRDEITGAPDPSGDFLPNAQGEDVVSGVRTPRDISEMQEWLPDTHAELMNILRTLETHYGDMQDTEFTVEDGRLFMLQTRNAKRPAQAAVRFAVDAVREGLLNEREAIMTIDSATLDTLLHPRFDTAAAFTVLAKGVNASPGAAKGEIVFTAADAVAAGRRGTDVILVRPFTDAEDVAGFHAAAGIVTSEGGKASHAALVARGMGRPAVVGAQELIIDLKQRTVTVGDTVLHESDVVVIDGTSGIITVDDVPLIPAAVNDDFQEVLRWSDQIRDLEVRANADTPEDARKAREFGAQGIGLCRTEHMFMAEDRQPKMRRMIMADDRRAREAALVDLLELQQRDFEGLFEAMTGLPVTIRLLDPPLHEFLPNLAELATRVERARIQQEPELSELERLQARVQEISEENPMLGTRGCRLGILYPEIYEMQARAIFRAAKAAVEPPHVEVMIPLVGYEAELEIMRKLVTDIGDEEGLRVGADYTVGTMIELPRACFVANRIAVHADFFSFGTNDLTQTALGFSRDDVESAFVPEYIERRIIDRSRSKQSTPQAWGGS